MGDVAVYQNDKAVEKKTIAEITFLHNEIKSLMSRTFEKGLQLGDILCRIKSELPHGEFISWVEQNCPFTRMTAHRYMLVFEKRKELELSGIVNLGQAYKFLTSKCNTVLHLKSETVSLLDEEFEDIDSSTSLGMTIGEITDEDLSEKEKEIERLQNELEELKASRHTEKKEALVLKKENESYKSLIKNIKSMRDVIIKIKEIDKRPADEALYEVAEVETYIQKCEKFFLKYVAGIEELPIERLTIKAMREPIKRLLTAMDDWAVRVAKRFKVKLDDNGDDAE